MIMAFLTIPLGMCQGIIYSVESLGSEMRVWRCPLQGPLF